MAQSVSQVTSQKTAAPYAGSNTGSLTAGIDFSALEKTPIATRNNPVKGFKGLKKNADGTLQCRDLVYEVGTIYCHDSTPKTCTNGFHFCENLNDVYSHYTDSDPSHVFYEVEAWGQISKDNDKSSSQFIMLTKPVSAKQIFLAKVKPYLKKVDKILAANPNAIICGSLALILRGWIPFREVGDIDILLPSFQEFGQYTKTVNSFGKSGEETIQIRVNDVEFDLFVDPAETWSWMKIGEGRYKVAHIKKLVEAKMRYYMTGAHKHGKDIEFILKQIDKHHYGDRNAFLKNGGLMKEIIDENGRTNVKTSESQDYRKVQAKSSSHDHEDLGRGFWDDDLEIEADLESL